MKKLAVILGLAGILMANRYPIAFEYHYMIGCANSKAAQLFKKDVVEKYCICTLKAIEDKYTLNEVLEKLSDPDKKLEIIKYATNKCIKDLKE